MIKGLGVDLVKVSRIKKLIDKWDNRFLNKIYTDQETEYCQQYAVPAVHFAGRFAAKEAVLKMIGTGLSAGISWQELEISNDQLGKPLLVLRGQAKKIVQEKKIEKIHLSISHDNNYALAEAIGEGGLS